MSYSSLPPPLLPTPHRRSRLCQQWAHGDIDKWWCCPHPVRNSRPLQRSVHGGLTTTVHRMPAQRLGSCLEAPNRGQSMGSIDQGEHRKQCSSPWGDGSTKPGKPGPPPKPGVHAFSQGWIQVCRPVFLCFTSTPRCSPLWSNWSQ